MITINFGPSDSRSSGKADGEAERNTYRSLPAAGMASTRGLEQDFGQLYLSEPSDGHQPRPAYTSPQRQGPQPFRNGTGFNTGQEQAGYLGQSFSGYQNNQSPSYPSQPQHMIPQYHDPMNRKWNSGAPFRQEVVPPSGNHGHRKLGPGSDLGVHPIMSRQEYGLPSFKPVVYPNPGIEDDSDEEEDQPQPQQRTTQVAGYYRSDAPAVTSSSQQQMRLTQIPVQHISSTKHMPGISHAGAVYAGVATSVPMSRAVNNNMNNSRYRPVQESDYVNAAVTSQTPEVYAEEEDFIPPAVPSKASYGSLSSASYTPQIKGPQYRIAPEVYGAHPAGIAQDAAPARGFHGHYPEPVSSKLMYTTPVAPAGQGFVESRPNTGGLSSGGGPPPPTYDTQVGYGPGNEAPTNPASAYPGGYAHAQQGQAAVPKTGLYNYSTEHVAPSGGGDKKEAEVDALTQMLMQNMEAAADPEFFGPCASCGRQVRGIYNACVALDNVYHISCFRCRLCGMCARCGRSIMGDNAGCSALDQLYHVDCFSCIACGHGLGGQPFFAMEGKPYCETCYMNTLEKCSVCSKPITDRILRATGKPYHPACFMCVVCGKSLDGVPFTVDATNQIHCIEDFHKKFAPRCCVCGEPILPDSGQEETIRIVAMDKSFHVGCYRCEDCGLVLSSEAEGRGCYPLDDHILCKNCNARRIQTLTTKMTTEL